MSVAFQQLTVRGIRYVGQDIITWARSFATAHPDDPNGPLLLDLCHSLVNGNGALPARTSGTTGAPKESIIPYADLLASTQLTAETFALREGDPVLLCLPLDFIAGRMMVVRAFLLGLDLHIADARGDRFQHIDADQRFRFAAMVPQQLQRMVTADVTRVDEQFDTVLLGGGPVNIAQEQALQPLRTSVFHGYASTETVTHVALRALNGAARSDLFHALGEVTFSVDEARRLIVNTPHLYIKEHRTTDIVELSGDRHFRWIGRYDNVILSGGLKIHPERLEERTQGIVPYPHFFTSQPDAVLGQRAVLVVEADRSAEALHQELMPLLSTVLKKHELPRDIIIQRIQRTSAGKPIRKIES